MSKMAGGAVHGHNAGNGGDTLAGVHYGRDADNLDRMEEDGGVDTRAVGALNTLR